MESKEQKELSDICKDAELRKLRRGDALLCGSRHGIAPQYSVPMLREGDVCVATTFFSSGHASPDAYFDKAKMMGCPYRRT